MMGYLFNGIDVFTEYGIVFRKGTHNKLLKLPKRKEGLAINWANENGTERYLGEVFYETLTYDLPILITAQGESDFWNKYNAFCDFLIASGEFNFDVTDLNRRFKVSYSNMTSFDKLTSFKSGQVGVFVTLQLFNDHPTEREVIP